MKKPERLNDMLLYLNDKKYFNLRHIMDKYHISKSTALRDIQSLEAMGMPIYSKPGRNGYYGILPNRLLSPVVFTVDEVQALYFSMQTLKAYQSTPFHLDIERLKNKFEACLSEEYIKTLRKMEKIFTLGSYSSKSECRLLNEITQMALNERVCEIGYRKQRAENQYCVQFFDITSAYGQWYATGYNFETQKPRVFRCDKIQYISSSEKYSAKPIFSFMAEPRELYREQNAVDFEIGVSPKGADIFYKEHYPSMELYHEAGICYIRGFYNPGEEEFIARYFLMYGDTITSIRPACLQPLILDRLSALRNHIAAITPAP